MNKTWIFGIGAVVVLILAFVVKESTQSGGSGGRRGPNEIPVELVTVHSELIQVRAESVGTAYSRESVDITANVTDTIESIHFEDGAKVKKDDILVVLTHNEEDAELKSAQANLSEQEREVKRLQGLIASKSVSQNALDERLTLRETAAHRVESVQARLRDRFIRAPFDGVLGLRQVSPGTLVSPGKIITTLDDSSTMKLDFSLPAVHLNALQNSKIVEASSPALGENLIEGKVVSIDSRINPVDRSIKVRAELPNKDNKIKHGMLMHVNILLANREGLVISEGALVQMRDQHFVYKAMGAEDLRAQLQLVEIGIRQAGRVEIIKGLSVGDRVVTRGASLLSPNAKIRVVQPTESKTDNYYSEEFATDNVGGK